jgi:hypothetical protein
MTEYIKNANLNAKIKEAQSNVGNFSKPSEGCHAEHTLYLSLIFLFNYAYIL